MRQIHIPWCTLTQTIRDISTLAWAGIVKQFACSIKQGIYVINVWCFITDKQCLQVWGSGRVGPQIRILTARINSVYKNPSLGSRQSEPQTRKVDYPSKKVNFRGLKSGNRFQFFFQDSQNMLRMCFLQKTASHLVKFCLGNTIYNLHPSIWASHSMLYFQSRYQRNIV